MLKCHKGLELDTIPEFDLGEKTESSEALNCVPTVERSSSRNFARLSRRALFFQSRPVFIGRAMHRELEAPSGSIRDLSIVELSPRLTQASLTMEVLVARVRRSMISRRCTRLRKRAPACGSRPSRTIRFRDCWNA